MQRNSLRPSPLCCDAIDKIWLHIARQLGFDVQRTEAAYASSDGRGAILIGAVETLDTDDCVAQLVFHELCHALIQGEGNLNKADWGLENTDIRDISREYAALRLQAYLADLEGLRELMPPTTQWRPYYEELPAHALEGVDEAAALVRIAMSAELFSRWQPSLRTALRQTREQLFTMGAVVTAKERAFQS